MDAFPQYVRMNREEVDRFASYLNSNGITVPRILREVVESKADEFVFDDDQQFQESSQGIAPGNPFSDAVLCTTCIETIVTIQAGPWIWWQAKKGSTESE